MSTHLQLNMAPAGDRGSCQTSDFPFSPPPLHLSTFPNCFHIFSNRTRRAHQKAVRGEWGGGSVGGVVQKRVSSSPTYVYGGSLVPQLSEFCRLWVPSRYVWPQEAPPCHAQPRFCHFLSVLGPTPPPLSFGDIFWLCNLINFSCQVSKD